MEKLLQEILTEIKYSNELLGRLVAMTKAKGGCQEKHSKEMMEKMSNIMGGLHLDKILERLNQPKTGG